MENKVNIQLSTGFGIHLRWCRISTINSRCWFNSGVYIPIIKNFLQKSRKAPSPIWRRKHAIDGGNSNTFSNVHPYLGKWSRLTSICLRWVETTNQHFLMRRNKKRIQMKSWHFYHSSEDIDGTTYFEGQRVRFLGWDNSHLTVSATLKHHQPRWGWHGRRILQSARGWQTGAGEFGDLHLLILVYHCVLSHSIHPMVYLPTFTLNIKINACEIQHTWCHGWYGYWHERWDEQIWTKHFRGKVPVDFGCNSFLKQLT